jgi:diaminohydroxyphosphoribosylaminopyrimidine deaminase/5-amino-6-(5-phosphoribosylamino)uracil reductase
LSKKDRILQQDLDYLELAFKLAQNGELTTSPNPPVGCVLVKDETVIGEGWHQWSGQAHAEVNAIADAIAKEHNTEGATAYVTLEPCNHTGETPPCTEALLRAKICRVVIALVDVDKRTAGLGIEKLKANGIIVDSKLAEGTQLQKKVKKLCRGYLSRTVKKRPWISLKIASSLDGKVALNNGESQWITGEEARADVHLLRCKADVILTTSRTIEVDNPRFTVRLCERQKQQLGLSKLEQELTQPVLAILSSRLSIPVNPDIQIFHTDREIWIFYDEQMATEKVADFEQALNSIDGMLAKVRLIPVATRNENAKVGLNLHKIFAYFGEKQINSVFVEAGAQLNGSLLQAKKEAENQEGFYPLIDECIYYINTKVMGHQAHSSFVTSMISRMQDVHSFSIQEIEKLSQSDIKLVLR